MLQSKERNQEGRGAPFRYLGADIEPLAACCRLRIGPDRRFTSRERPSKDKGPCVGNAEP